jgi:hypothetical protein
MQFRKYRKFAAISIVLAFLLPALVTATVVISYTYPINTSTSTPTIYLGTGENYVTANSMHLINATNVKSPAANVIIPSGTKIYINGTSDAANTTLLNVLEIYNTSSGLKGTVNVWINGTLPTGVTMYYSASPITYSSSGSGSWISGTKWSSGAEIPLPSSTTIYLAFQVLGTATGAASLNIQYSVT